MNKLNFANGIGAFADLATIIHRAKTVTIMIDGQPVDDFEVTEEGGRPVIHVKTKPTEPAVEGVDVGQYKPTPWNGASTDEATGVQWTQPDQPKRRGRPPKVRE